MIMQAWLAKSLAIIVGSLLILTLTGFSSERTPIPDAQLVSAIKQRLQMDGRIDAKHITVQALNGHITLGGIVETMVEKVLAEGIVSNTILGVRSVVNDLSVRPAVIQDDAIKKSVRKNLITTPALEGTSIQVNVRDGIVRLEGRVDNLVQRRAARKAAELVKGIVGVIDVLKVAQISRPDSEIEKEVALYLLWSPIVNIDQIEVEVKRGVVKLIGSVDHMAHLLTVEQDLEKITGVVEVDISGLQVQS
jgi:hyperosmotically inducible periplasmic protein